MSIKEANAERPTPNIEYRMGKSQKLSLSRFEPGHGGRIDQLIIGRWALDVGRSAFEMSAF